MQDSLQYTKGHKCTVHTAKCLKEHCVSCQCEGYKRVRGIRPGLKTFVSLEARKLALMLKETWEA